MYRLPFVCLALLSAVSVASAQDSKSIRLTFCVRGVETEEDAAPVRKALSTVPGIKYNADDIRTGEKGRFGHYFSPPFTIDIADLNKTDIGVIAKAVAEAKTAKGKDIPPSLNLVLYNPALTIGSAEVNALRAAVGDLNGLEARERGGTGGVPGEARFWIRIDGSGAARLEDVQNALRKANLQFTISKE